MLEELVTRDGCCWCVGSLDFSMDNIKDGHEPVRIRKIEAQNMKIEQSGFSCCYCFVCKLCFRRRCDRKREPLGGEVGSR